MSRKMRWNCTHPPTGIESNTLRNGIRGSRYLLACNTYGPHSSAGSSHPSLPPTPTVTFKAAASRCSGARVVAPSLASCLLSDVCTYARAAPAFHLASFPLTLARCSSSPIGGLRISPIDFYPRFCLSRLLRFARDTCRL